MRTTQTGRTGARAFVILLSAMLLIAALPLNARAAAFLISINTEDSSNWSWPAMAQTFEVLSPIEAASILLHRSPTDTGTYRVEVRTAPGGVPSGYQAPSSGVVLASKTLNAATLSTSAASPTLVNVVFDSVGIAPAGTTKLALVVIRGTNSGLKWHASNPSGSDNYANGNAYLCVIGDCWSGQTPAGPVDFVAQVSGSFLAGSAPRASVIAPHGPTRASSFTWTTIFDQPVSGLTASDFTKSGTADNCSLGAPSSGDGVTWTMKVSNCTAGTLALTLRAAAVPVPVSGPSSAVKSAATLRIDRSKPTATTPMAVPQVGRSLDGTLIPTKIYWSTAADSGGAGVKRYDVGRSTDGGSTWTTLGTTQKTNFPYLQASSGTVIYRVRTVDWANNKSAWRATPTFRPRLAQETSSAATFSSGWSSVADPIYSGGSARVSSKSGAAVRYTFSGRGISFVTSTGTGYGIAKIYLDGTLVKTLDLSTLGDHDVRIVYAKRFSSYGTHVIRVVTGSAAPVVVDAFARL
ncbi:MAG TPA: hypothetical protein VFY23_04860 [Candidatus Limnocylindrales bacterium]|nr:hypothetical protein [Candidatus Limnocylindrales bacterium]